MEELNLRNKLLKALIENSDYIINNLKDLIKFCMVKGYEDCIDDIEKHPDFYNCIIAARENPIQENSSENSSKSVETAEFIVTLLFVGAFIFGTYLLIKGNDMKAIGWFFFAFLVKYKS